MKWFVIVSDVGVVFECADDTTGRENVINFIIEDMEELAGIKPTDTDYYSVIRGEERKFVPPAAKGTLV